MWFNKKPKQLEDMWMLDYPHREFVYAPHPFKELAPYQGDWKDSLRRIPSPKRTKKETWIRGKVPKGIDLYKAFGIKKED